MFVNEKKDSGEPPKGRKDEIAVGIASTVGFAAAYFFTGYWFLIFPLVFIGLIPMSVGISKYFRNRKKPPEKITDEKNRILFEKEVLKAARDLLGRVTVLQVASHSNLSVEDARETLDGLVKKGYVQLFVEESGVLRYEFTEFLPENKITDT